MAPKGIMVEVWDRIVDAKLDAVSVNESALSGRSASASLAVRDLLLLLQTQRANTVIYTDPIFSKFSSAEIHCRTRRRCPIYIAGSKLNLWHCQSRILSVSHSALRREIHHTCPRKSGLLMVVLRL